MESGLVLVDPWWDLRGGGADEESQRDLLLGELRAEVAEGHPLAGVKVEVIGRSEARDDVLVLAEDGRWSVVHLTWKRGPERPPWPSVRFYGSVRALEQALADD